jgi:DNA-binding GntR family transcriptional regulator
MADRVAEELRAAIHAGDLADQAVLNQTALAAHFGVSRVPVREAMRQLEAEGLIETRAYHQAVVCALDSKRVREVYELRALLEGFVVERATPLVPAERLAELERLAAEMLEADSHSGWLELNAQFHRLLYEPSGDLATLELIDHLRARGERYVRLWSGGNAVRRGEEAGREHAQILAHVAAGDARAARRAVEEHVAHTRDRVLALGPDGAG